MAIKQLTLYISILILAIEGGIGVKWSMIHFSLQHCDDPNEISSLEKQRTNLILAGIVGVSILGIIGVIKAFFT
jgi:hypothetical protein